MTGAESTLPSSTMAKGRFTFAAVISAKNCRAKRCRNGRRRSALGCCWSNPARASVQPLAAQRNTDPSHWVLLAGLGIGKQRYARRQAIALRRESRRPWWNAHLGRAAEEFARKPRRNPEGRGSWTSKPVGADALDGRFGHPDLIDALAHDLQALLERRIQPITQPGLRQHKTDLAFRRRHFDIRRSRSKSGRGNGHGKSAQDFERPRLLRLIGDADGDRVADDADRPGLDALVAKRATRVVQK